MSDSQPYPLTNLSDQGECEIVFFVLLLYKIGLRILLVKGLYRSESGMSLLNGGLFVNTTTVPFTAARVSSERNVSRKKCENFFAKFRIFSRK